MILLTHNYKKDRQCNSQNKKGKKTNNCRENTTQKTTFHSSERMNWFLQVKRNINGYIWSELFSDSEPTKFCSSPQCYLISGETANTNCIVFELTWLGGGGREFGQNQRSNRIKGDHNYHYTTYAVGKNLPLDVS